MPDLSNGEISVDYITTIAVSDRGNYHLADDDDLALRPLCGAGPTQRAVSIPIEKFDPMNGRWFCSRCYYLQTTDGKWDGR